MIHKEEEAAVTVVVMEVLLHSLIMEVLVVILTITKDTMLHLQHHRIPQVVVIHNQLLKIHNMVLHQHMVHQLVHKAKTIMHSLQHHRVILQVIHNLLLLVTVMQVGPRMGLAGTNNNRRNIPMTRFLLSRSYRVIDDLVWRRSDHVQKVLIYDCKLSRHVGKIAGHFW